MRSRPAGPCVPGARKNLRASAAVLSTCRERAPDFLRRPGAMLFRLKFTRRTAGWETNMQALRSILVLMEPALETQAAFEAALPIAGAFGASIHMLMTDYRDLHVSFYQPPAPGLVQFRESVQAAHRVTLERCVERAGSLGVAATFE